MKTGKTGGIEAIIKAINTHINNDDVCKNGCGALCNIAANNSKNSGSMCLFMTNLIRNQRNCQEIEHC